MGSGSPPEAVDDLALLEVTGQAEGTASIGFPEEGHDSWIMHFVAGGTLDPAIEEFQIRPSGRRVRWSVELGGPRRSVEH